MADLIHPVLLCGGSGTRLWPMSRKSYPKQFVKLTGAESLYQASARRLSGAGFAAPTVVNAADFRFIVIEQLAALEIAPADILIEPSAKNTAAAICAAALTLEARAPGTLMLVAPSDHVIPDAYARLRSRAATPPQLCRKARLGKGRCAFGRRHALVERRHLHILHHRDPRGLCQARARGSGRDPRRR